MDFDDLEELLICLDNLRNDLNDNEPDEETVAHLVWDMLQDRIEQCIDAIGKRLWDLEEEEA